MPLSFPPWPHVSLWLCARRSWGTAGWVPTWVTSSSSTCARLCTRCCRTDWRPTCWTWSSDSGAVSPGAWWRPPLSWVRMMMMVMMMKNKQPAVIHECNLMCVFVSLRSVHTCPPQPVLQGEPVLRAHQPQHETQRLHLRPPQVSHFSQILKKVRKWSQPRDGGAQ